MNKKIFTLLAGAFLMFAAVFSVNAQGPMWSKSVLSIGDSVRTLELGMNRGYYHLQVQSIDGVNYRDSNQILYLGKHTTNDSLLLFVDSINYARTNFPSYFSSGTNTSKAEESAAGLWCVNIDTYDNGKTVIYDFINKEHEEMLEVDVFGYESWAAPTDAASHMHKSVVPGGISGWAFSTTYATQLEGQPLVSHIGIADTVAVLCLDTTVTGNTSILVKIADLNDVRAGRVTGVIYFKLMHAAPFIINQDDYNQHFGRKPAGNSGQLSFDPDVATGQTNVFSQNLLEAVYLGLADTAKRIVARYPYLTGAKPTAGATNYDTLAYTSAMLDSMGYMRFRNGSNYVSVLPQYFPGNAGGHQYLQIGYRPASTGVTAGSYFGAQDTPIDSLLYGQSVFRMVYYPSGDSIYINPYQATYLPTLSTADLNDYSISANGWTDSATLAVFTYFADTEALQNPTGWPVWPATPAAFTEQDSLNLMIARLKNGYRTTGFYEEFRYYHKLYVSLQNLTGGNFLTLFTNSVQGSLGRDHRINTHINFDIYTPCVADGRGKTTVAPDVYLIRNTAGQYLQVPLYSSTDSAMWVGLQPNVDPRYIPSFHWVVEQRYVGSATSPVNITSREFDWQEFINVQLTTQAAPFKLRSQNFSWNDQNVVANVTTWENRINNNYAFVKLEKEFKNDPLLGYTWIDPDTSIVNAYAFNLQSGISDDYYIGWQGNLNAYPNTDTTVFVKYDSYFDKMYFTLDTINENGYGELQEYGYDAKRTTQIADLVTLERQAYRLTYKDPFKYRCVQEFSLAPGEDGYYGITKRGIYKDYLGKPVFYLRHHYKVEGKDPYFSLVQRIDSTTTDPSNTTAQAALRAYLSKIYNPVMANQMMQRLNQPNFNEGIFVAQFEAATAKLLMTLRIDASKEVTTFSLEKDVDPLYRRFNTLKEGDEANDNPDFVHFFTINNPNEFMFENTGMLSDHKAYWEPGKKNYLGLLSKSTWPNADSHSSTIIYVDTAYVNRGTGYIKPQYLLAVRPTVHEPAMGCDDQGEPVIPLAGYVEAYYLINAHDSAHLLGGRTNSDYLWKDSWHRLVFTRAIHANDHLYILGDEELPSSVYGSLVGGAPHMDVDKLHTYATSSGNNIHAIYLGTNTHKDVVFQFRLIERRADDFLIESETTSRDTINGPMIAPCEGGWIKFDNGVGTITVSDQVDGIGQSEVFNVTKASRNEALSNDNLVTSNVVVVGSEGAVTIQNAAGKTVVINNILGQTVAKTVLTSDSETISAPTGVVIVSVDGETAVKALVK